MTDFISGKGWIFNCSISQPESDGGVLTPEAMKQALEGIRNWHYKADFTHCKYRVRVWCIDCLDIDPLGCFEGKKFLDPEEYDGIEQAIRGGDEWIKASSYLGVRSSSLCQYEIIDPFGRLVNIDE
jgi:hypothetical protein